MQHIMQLTFTERLRPFGIALALSGIVLSLHACGDSDPEVTGPTDPTAPIDPTDPTAPVDPTGPTLVAPAICQYTCDAVLDCASGTEGVITQMAYCDTGLNRCVSCLENDDCKLPALALTRYCDADNACPDPQTCVTVLGRNRCATIEDAATDPELCPQKVDAVDLDDQAVTVCLLTLPNEDVSCSDAGECVATAACDPAVCPSQSGIPGLGGVCVADDTRCGCEENDDCSGGLVCNTDTNRCACTTEYCEGFNEGLLPVCLSSGFCGCGSDEHCGENERCSDAGSCVCANDTFCEDALSGSVCLESGVCGCADDIANCDEALVSGSRRAGALVCAPFRE